MPIHPDDRARYPTTWRAISKRIRTERAGDRCECDGRCGLDHGGRCSRVNREPIPGNEARRTILTVAHLDHQPENNDDGNLMTMCQGCHLRYDAAHHRESRARRRAK